MTIRRCVAYHNDPCGTLTFDLSRSHECHYSTWHTALWSCTHIPNIPDQSGKTKKLWSGQASLRRSGRKNQTKTFVGPWSLTSRSNNCFLNSIIQLIMCNLLLYRAALRGDISFRYLKQFFLVIFNLLTTRVSDKYNWPIWKDKKVMVRTSFAEKKRKKKSD
jgi:hypothetical protein